MNNNSEERLLDLLTMSVTQNLTVEEIAEMRHLETVHPDLGGVSWELAATSLSLANLKVEPIPEALSLKVLAQANEHYGFNVVEEKVVDYVSLPKRFDLKSESSSVSNGEDSIKMMEFKPRRSSNWFGWTGWATAALASLLLLFTLFTNTTKAPIIVAASPTPTPKVLSPGEQREQVLAENTPELVKLDLGEPNPASAKGISGDVVWDNVKQKGFLRLRGIPKNDLSKETYQIWVGDSNQANPIDGGIFDVTADGEMIVPINAKLKVLKPTLFAVTLEKAGGVVVSKLDKLVVAAKVAV